MRFGFETVIWGRRIGDLELALDQIAACGYEGVEFSQLPSDLRLRDRGVIGGSRPVKNIAELLRLLEARTLELISLAGGPLIDRLHFCEGHQLPYFYLAGWEDDAEAVLQDSTRPVLGLHPHWFFRVDRLAKARKILESHPHPNLRLLPDTAHLMLAGDDPLSAIKEFRQVLAAVHIKDWSPSFGRFSHRYAHGFVPLGKGIAPISAVLNELRATDYDGWVVVEQDSAQSTPVQSARECAEWLRQGGWMTAGERPMPTLPGTFGQESRASRRSDIGRAREADFLESLSRATSRPLLEFYQEVVEALQRHLGCPGVSLWSLNAAREDWQRVSAAGVTTEASVSRLSCKHEWIREVLQKQRPLSFYLRERESAPFVGEALSAKPIDLLAIPIFNNRNSYHLRQLLIVIWPGGRRTSVWLPEFGDSSRVSLPVELKEEEESELANIVEHIDRTGDLLRDELCSSAVGYTSWVCSHARTQKELLTGIVEHIRRTLGCDGVAVFLENEAIQRIESVSSQPPTRWRDDIPMHERNYGRGQGVMGHVWESGEIRFTTTACPEPDGEKRSWEVPFEAQRHDALCFPMVASSNRAVGVIRCTNKSVPAGTHATLVFTDDDAAILDAIVQTMLPHLEVLMEQEEQLEAMARQIHETKMPLTGLRAAHDWFRHLNSGRSDEEEKILADMWQWTEMLNLGLDNARMLRPGRSELTVSPVPSDFKNDIFAPVLKHARLLLGEDEWRKAQIDPQIDLPIVNVDRGQWMQVVFNLLSNACKYRGKQPLRFKINAWRAAAEFIITFEDYGQGIPAELKEIIFRSHVRAPDAVRSHVAGQGIGLAVVRSITEAHGGTVKLTRNSQPTSFEIRLPSRLGSATVPSAAQCGIGITDSDQ